MSLATNLQNVKSQILAHAQTAGIDPDRVRLIAVSKTVDSQKIRKMHALGQSDFGENRPQALRDKARELADLQIRWHFIGQLQTNKIKYVYPVAALVHSVDRRELLEEFIAWHQRTGRKCPLLLQVHISRESAKQGFACEEILDIVREYSQSPHLDMRGMMGMAPLDGDDQAAAQCFRELAGLLASSRALAGQAWNPIELSMGMSGDFHVAIAEGATMVRIGTALFAEESSA
ncbi:MAG: YggS family pyridoxal phosphate-dependent enzyme [Candidatus Riflebacteria bacterium]|nr:YggS family pyridoxal phosphate-dependent enzyme [Candidatus Riflebacteria bacterium]